MNRCLDYMRENRIIGKYGIKYLDNRLKGICLNDLVMLGARSGAGKSTIANMIALANVENKVALFSLENFKDDDFVKECFYRYVKRVRRPINIIDFMCGNEALDLKILEEIEQEVEDAYKNVYTVCRKDGYNIKNLEQDVEDAVNKGIQIIILDHIDYLDKINATTNDVVHISEISKTIRKLQNKYRCAFICISHLRKSNNKNPIIIPNMDEFIGSSNKVKESTVVITFAPDDKNNEEFLNNNKKSTFCCVRKSRRSGMDNRAARLYFDKITGRYLEEYEDLKVNYSGTEVENI